MTTHHRPSPTGRDLAVRRLRQLTFGVAIGGIAAGTGVAAVAAATPRPGAVTAPVADPSDSVITTVPSTRDGTLPSDQGGAVSPTDPGTTSPFDPGTSVPQFDPRSNGSQVVPAPVPPTRGSGRGHVSSGGS